MKFGHGMREFKNTQKIKTLLLNAAFSYLLQKSVCICMKKDSFLQFVNCNILQIFYEKNKNESDFIQRLQEESQANSNYWLSMAKYLPGLTFSQAGRVFHLP